MTLSIKLPDGNQFEKKFTGLGYVGYFAHPNFWFHLTTAYGILRKEGVDLGKYPIFGVDTDAVFFLESDANFVLIRQIRLLERSVNHQGRLVSVLFGRESGEMEKKARER